MMGAVALVVAAVGAISGGQARSAGEDAAAMTSARGTYSATLSAATIRQREASLDRASLRARQANRISRSSSRPSLAADKVLLTAAERQAARRERELRSTADKAESYAAELASNRWVTPVRAYRLTTLFGEAGPLWSSGRHTGVDLAAGYGTPVVAATNARVQRAGWDGAYGNQIRLRLENGDEIWYNHLSSIEATAGQAVKKGQRVGRVGETGNAYGCHLHLEYRRAGDRRHAVDPMPFFARHEAPL